MRPISILFWMTVASLLALPVAAKEYRCPDAVTTKATLGGLPSEWQQRAPYAEPADAVPVTLKNVNLYSGDPIDGALLAPVNADNPENKNQAIYAFPSDQSDDHYIPWLSCEYRNTPIMATLPLPRGTKSCVVSYEPRGDYSEVKRIECR